MMLVDLDRGRADGLALAKTLEQLSNARDAPEVQGDDNLSEEVRSELEDSYSYQRS